MPAITVFVHNIPSIGLNFVAAILNNGKNTPSTTVIMLNIPSVGLSFYDFILNIPSARLKFPSIMPDFYLSDYAFGILVLRRIKEVVNLFDSAHHKIYYLH